MGLGDLVLVRDLDLVGVGQDIMGAGLDNSRAVRDITGEASRAGMEMVLEEVSSRRGFKLNASIKLHSK